MKTTVSRLGMLLLTVIMVVVLAGAGPAQALGGGRIDGQADAFFTGNVNDQAGASAAVVGDVNGDGYADIAIGAPLNDLGPGNDAGAVYLVLGGPKGWGLRKFGAQAPVLTYTGEADSDHAGTSVTGVGDFNGDGFDDFVIGAPLNDDVGGAGSNTGAVYLVLGSASPAGGALGTVGIEYTGEVAGDNAGDSVAGAGDFNGDGFADFVVGAPFNDDGAGAGTDDGAAYIVLGTATPPAPATQTSLGTVGIEYMGELGNDQAGQSVGGGGDTDGDGLGDVIVGAPLNDDGAGNDGGAVYLIVGTTTPPAPGTQTSLGVGTPTVVEFTGDADSDNAGSSVANAGDVNGDGFDDVVIGAPLDDSGGGAGSNTGSVYVLFGRPGMPANTLGLTSAEFPGETGNDAAGTSVAGAGDVNADGYADVVAGAPTYSTTDMGAAYLIAGGPEHIVGGQASLSTAIRYTGALNNDQLGLGTAGGGDVNGDGHSDFMVGAALNDSVFSSGGAEYVIFGDDPSSDQPAFRQRRAMEAGTSGNTLPVTLDQLGVRVDYTAGALDHGDINATKHLFHPCSTDKRLPMPIWTIDSPKLNSGATSVNLRFKYNNAQIAGMTEASLSLWTRPAGEPCSVWTQVPGSAVDTAHNFIAATLTNPTALGQFTISVSAPGPTSIDGAEGQVQPGEPPKKQGELIALLLLLTGLGLLQLYLRRRTPPMAVKHDPAER